MLSSSCAEATTILLAEYSSLPSFLLEKITMSLDSFRSSSSSAPNSKRTFSSPSANRSNYNSNSANNNNNKKRQKTTNQKTLGVAWGSNSSSSSSSRKSPFSDFGSYMTEKNRKLHNQFNAEASTSSFSGASTSGNPVFVGVSIFVDGFTVPSSQELRGYMLKHGGKFENYFSRHRVTHIICSNLADSKVKNLRAFSAGLPVVKPTWILDSVTANRLLSWVPYQLDQLPCNQPKLSAFFSSRNSKMSGDAFKNALCQVESDAEDSSTRDCKSEDKHSSKVGKKVEPIRKISIEADDVVSENTNSSMKKELTSVGIICDEDLAQGSNGTAKDARNVQGELQPNNQEPHSSKVGKMVEPSRNTNTKADDTVSENTNSILMKELTSIGVICDEEGLAGGSNDATKDERNVDGELEPNSQEPSTSITCSDDQNVNELPSSAATRPSKLCHSTLADPNFVENYFKSSRLHFIGTWRSRYRKRFPILSTGVDNEMSNISAPGVSGNSLIIHIDMDCFFVSVVIKNRPELLDKPVAVCHSNNSKGTAEISSANYPARTYGIRAGMFVRDAKALCSNLVIFPYNFEAYEEVADQFYSILHRHCNKVQAVSCDEAFLDVTHSNLDDPELLASSIRKEIYETTGCTASAGIAGNMLMARIATRTAKPNGQYHITPEMVEDHLRKLPINALPGVGHVLQEKMMEQNVHTCGQLQMISKASLQKDYGMKTGEMLWNYSRGIDNRFVGVFQESKSIGADVNWGVRFKDIKDCEHFLINLCKEVSLRLQGCCLQGRTFSLKIKKRRKDADEPVKFMGCGDCENLSHSVTIPLATDNVEILQRIAKQLFGSFYLDVKEIRGIGLHVSRLESIATSKQGGEKYSLKSWVTSGSANMGKQKHHLGIGHDKQNMSGTSPNECRDSPVSSLQMDNNIQNNLVSTCPVSTPPPLCQLDVEVVRNLPPEVLSELNEIYGGKLVDYIAKGKGIATNKEEELFYVEPIPKKEPLSKIGALSHEAEGGEAVPNSGSGHFFDVTHNSSFEKDDLLPSSLSQVDRSVLGELPEDLKAVIVQQLPAHRRQDICSSVAVVPPSEKCQVALSIMNSESPESNHHVSNECLWAGNPPKWVKMFKASSCLILKKLADLYYKSGLTGMLSSVLHQIISELHLLAHQISDDSVNIMCELLKQYIQVKIGSELEEIYICFRLLKRFAEKSEFFLQVYNGVFPYLQEAVDDSYGGNLFITP